jgi:hypothetical protein
MKVWTMLYVVMLAAGGWGASFYVSKSGNNTTGASWAAAWNELNQINWTNINPGDTVKLAGGTYTTALTLSKAGTSAGRIRVMRATEAGYNGKVTLTGSMTISQPFSASVGVLVTQPFITVDGIDKNNFEFYAPGVMYILVNVNNVSDYFEIKNAFFRNTPDGACWMRSIYVANGSLNIDHCELFRSQCQEDIISYKTGYDAASQGSKLKIQNSILRDWVSISGSHSDMVEGGTTGAPLTDSLIFIHNLVDDGVTNGHNICFMVYNTFKYVDMSYNVFKDVYQVLQGTYRAGRIVNNTYFRTAGEGGSGVNTFANNIFADDATLTTADRYNWEKYSLFHNTYYDNNFSAVPDKNGNLRGDPLFLNPESLLGADSIPFTADDGFNLQAGSAAIDKGTNVGIAADIRGTAITGPPDIGAYEYTSTAVRPWAGPDANAKYQVDENSIFQSPVSAAFLRRNLESTRNVTVYDFAGKIIEKNSVVRPGLYLVEQRSEKIIQKIIVIQ